MENKEELLNRIEVEKLDNHRADKPELDDSFTSIPSNGLDDQESKSVADQIENLIEKTKNVSLTKEDDKNQAACNDGNKCEEKRGNRNYFRKRFTINQPKNNYFNSKPKEAKKEEIRPTPASELKSRLDFRTRIPTIVDDVYLDRSNGHQKHKGNYKSHGQNSDKKFDKAFERNEKLDIVVTKDFKTSSRQVSLNNEKNFKSNRSNLGQKSKDDKFREINEVSKNSPHLLTPPLTPSSSKFDPPPGLPLPNNVNQNYADKEYAAAIAAFLLSNPIFSSNAAELAHLSKSGQQLSDSKNN